MSVVLRKKKCSKGLSLYLDIYHKGIRKYEFLNLYIKGENRSDVMEKARKIQKKFQDEITLGYYGISLEKSADDFTEFYLRYRHLNHFKKYKTCIYALMRHMKSDVILFRDIDELFCQRFKQYLVSTYQGETPYGYFKIFKKMLKDAARLGYFTASPAEYVTNENPTGRDIRKDILFIDEIAKLYKAHCGNIEVRRAFLFSLNTATRLVDCRRLTWKNIDLKNQTLTYSQSKTRKQNIVPLNSNAMDVLNMIDKKAEYLFAMPSSNAVNKVLGNWVKDAGIEKKITFHCSRHSAITHWYALTGDLKLSGSMAGHSSVKITERYGRIADEAKRRAVDSMQKF
jgi:integrase